MAERDSSGKFVKKGAGAEAAKETATAAEGASKGKSAFSKMADSAHALGGSALKKVFGATKALTPAISKLGGVIKTLSSGDLPDAKAGMSALGSAMGGALTSGAEKLSKVLGGLGPEGQAVGAAIEIMAGAMSATIGVFSQIMGMMIDAAQRADLMRDRFAALAGSAAGGKAVQASIAKLGATLPFATSKVGEWAQSLLAAGLQGKQLEESIKGIAAATALMGAQGGAAAEKMMKQLAEGGAAADKMIKALQAGGPKSSKLLADMGLHTADLAAAMGMTEAQFKKSKISAEQMNAALAKALQKKGAGPLADMMLSLPAILQKAREGFNSMFGGMGKSVKPFMQAVKSLFANFNKGTGGMKALQKVFADVFGTVFKYATMAVKAVAAFVKQNFTAKNIGGIWKSIKSAIGLVATALSPVIAIMKAVFSNAMVLNGIKTIFKVIGVAILIVVGVIGALMAAFATAAGMVGTFFGAVAGVVGSVLGVLGDLASGAVEAAGNFISGLVGGITGGAGAVVDAVSRLADSVIGGFKAKLGIASPSKVMNRMGGFAGAGAAQGLDQSAGKVEAAGAKVGDAAAAGTAQGMGAAGAGGGAKGKAVQVTVQAGAVVIHAGGATITDEGLATALERLLMAHGLGAR